MVDLRIIYKEQLDYCTEIAKDIIKHNGSREIMEYASEFCTLDYDYYDEDNAIFMDDTVRVWWCVYDTNNHKWSTYTCFGKYKTKKDCKYYIDYYKKAWGI